MGYEAACRLRVGEGIIEGKAVLEQHDLIFRGPTRLAIPLKEITSAVASGGSLRVRFGRRTATFELGRAASKWADRISNPPSRLDKLGVKAGLTIFVAGTLHADLISEITARGARVVRRVPSAGADIVFYGADRRQALNRVPKLKAGLKPNGALWIVRPKGSPAIGESDVLRSGRNEGLVDVKVVSFSETHTAEKFVIPRSAR
jgi:hypothetical protein